MSLLTKFIQASSLCGLLLLSACQSAHAPSPTAEEMLPEWASGFELELTSTRDEQSDDSNGSTTEVSIQGNHLDYEWNYSGYHPNEDFVTHQEWAKNLTEEEFNQLLDELEKLELLQNYTYSGEVIGIGEFIEKTLTIQVDGENYQLDVKGMEQVWGEDVDTTLSEEAQVVQENIGRLLSFLKKLGDES